MTELGKGATTDVAVRQSFRELRKRRKEVMERCGIEVAHGQVFVDGSYVASLNLIKDRHMRRAMMRAICYTAEAMVVEE